MRKFKTWAASAAALLLCFSASQAFAGLSLVSTQNIANSWQMVFTANAAGQIGNIPSGFTSIVATIVPGSYTYTVSPHPTVTIASPSPFEDLGTSGSNHDAWNGINGDLHNGFSNSSWAQVSSNGGAASTQTKSSGNQINAFAGGSGNTSLTFTLDFAGNNTDGSHFFLDFLNSAGQSIARYSVAQIYDNNQQVLELTQVGVPLPPAIWGGLAMFAGMGVFLVKRRRDRSLLA